MQLKLVRDQFNQLCTLGRLYIDGRYYCDTLEDTVRAVKVNGQTAIPEGTYEVVVDHSKRFDKDMPHVLNVPGFEGIRIHCGNTDKNTEGCVLVGFVRGINAIRESRKAFDKFFPLLQEAVKHGSVTLEVTSETGGRGAINHESSVQG